MINSNCWPAGVVCKYDRVELIADGIVHAIGVGLGLVGAIAIFVVAAHSLRTVEVASIAVYSAGLLSMLGFSAAYNIWPVSRTKWIRAPLRSLGNFRDDRRYVYAVHSADERWRYCDRPSRRSVADSGCRRHSQLLLPRRFDRLAVVLYLFLGWSGTVVYEPIVAALPSLSIWLLAIGGALYSMGVIFYAWQSLRFQNAIWHAFVLIAACCHYLALLFCAASEWS